MGIPFSKSKKIKQQQADEDFYDRSSDVIDDIVDRYLHQQSINTRLH